MLFLLEPFYVIHQYLGLASGPFFKFSTQIMYAFLLYMLSLLHVFLFHVSDDTILVILHENCRFCVPIFRLSVCKFNTHTKQQVVLCMRGYCEVLNPTYFPVSYDGINSVVRKRGLFMCRIASLFLLQRLKGSMSGDARDFSNMEMKAVMKFFFFLTRQGAEGN